MTKSETKAREIIKTIILSPYIKKMPDYKQVGNAGCKGLPDFLVINKEGTTWFEIKVSKTKKIQVTEKDFTSHQLVEFPKMADAGAKIIVMIFSPDLKYREIYSYSSTRRFVWEIGMPVI